MEMTVLKEKVSDWLERNNYQTIILQIAHEVDWDYYEDIGTMSNDFNRHFRDWEPYDIVNCLDRCFNADDTFFQEDGDIHSSDDLEDLIDYDRLAEKIADALLNGERFVDVDEDLESLYELAKEEKKERTPEEINAMLEELFNDEYCPINDYYTDVSGNTMYKMSRQFVDYMREFPIDHLSYLFAGIVNHAFAFNFDYFTEEEHELVGWDRGQVIEYLLKNVDLMQAMKDKLPEELVTILNGEWEDE